MAKGNIAQSRACADGDPNLPQLEMRLDNLNTAKR
jgi:hypothetical protein